jgi:hypothetical protein
MNDLSAYREIASALRSRVEGFDGFTHASFNGETGKYRAGKNKTDISGKRFVAGAHNVISGWQNYSAGDRKFYYGGHSYVRDGEEPLLRAQLPDRNEAYWLKSGQDPWSFCFYLPLFDEETREHLILTTSSSGGKDAVSDLIMAFADHNDGRDPTDYEWPIVELSSDSYINTHDKRIFKPIFDIVGWIKPPAAFRLPKPPATTAKVRTIEEIKKAESSPQPSDPLDDF